MKIIRIFRKFFPCLFNWEEYGTIREKYFEGVPIRYVSSEYRVCKEKDLVQKSSFSESGFYWENLGKCEKEIFWELVQKKKIRRTNENEAC